MIITEITYEIGIGIRDQRIRTLDFEILQKEGEIKDADIHFSAIYRQLSDLLRETHIKEEDLFENEQKRQTTLVTYQNTGLLLPDEHIEIRHRTGGEELDEIIVNMYAPKRRGMMSSHAIVDIINRESFEVAPDQQAIYQRVLQMTGNQ